MPHYQNVPFEVPSSWVWCKLEDYVKSVTDGDHQAPPKSDIGIPFLVISDVAKGKLNFLNTRFVPQEYYEKISFDRKPEKGDLLFTVTGSYGIVVPVNIDCKFCFQRHIGLIKTLNTSEYLLHLLKSSYIKGQCDEFATGTAQKTVGLETLRSFLLPIPPFAEQQRIVIEIEKWFSLIELIEGGKDDLQTTIKQAKSKILDLAIHGKLVPQDPNDEPPIELLKRINPDFTPCDNGHYTFDVPSGWITTNLGSIFNVVSAKRILKSDWKHSGVPFYRAREIAKLSIYGLVDNELYISEEHYNSLKEKFPVPKASDIMISAVGTIGKCYIVKESDKFYYKDASVLCLCNDYQINAKYIYHIMRSEYMLKQMYDNSKGTTVDTITIEKAKQYILPLPPLAEQQRIVAKICLLYTSRCV